MGKKTKGVNNKQTTGIDFIRAKKKVGRTIKKANNETDTTVKAKRINLPGQVLNPSHPTPQTLQTTPYTQNPKS
jgi:pre-rRNA-processing protein IPI1